MYNNRQNSGIKITGFFDKEGEDNSYINSGQVDANHTAIPSRETKKSGMPSYKNRFNQFSRTFCDDLNLTGGLKM